MGDSIRFRRLAAVAAASAFLLSAAPLLSTSMRDFKKLDKQGLVEAISRGDFTARVFCEDDGHRPVAISLSCDPPYQCRQGDERFYLPSMLRSISAAETEHGTALQINGGGNCLAPPTPRSVREDLSFLLTYDSSCGAKEDVNGVEDSASMKRAIEELRASAEFIREHQKSFEIGGAEYVVSERNKSFVYTGEMLRQEREIQESMKKAKEKREMRRLMLKFREFAVKFAPIGGLVLAPFVLVGIALLVRKAIKKAKESLRIARENKERRAREHEEWERGEAERRAQRREEQRRRDAERRAAEEAARQERIRQEDEVRKMKEEDRRMEAETERKIADARKERRETPERERKVDEQFRKDKSYYWKKLADLEKRYEGAETLEEVDVIERERMAIVDEILEKYPDRSLYNALKPVLNGIYITEDAAKSRVTGNPEWAERKY